MSYLNNFGKKFMTVTTLGMVAVSATSLTSLVDVQALSCSANSFDVAAGSTFTNDGAALATSADVTSFGADATPFSSSNTDAQDSTFTINPDGTFSFGAVANDQTYDYTITDGTSVLICSVTFNIDNIDAVDDGATGATAFTVNEGEVSGTLDASTNDVTTGTFGVDSNYSPATITTTLGGTVTMAANGTFTVDYTSVNVSSPSAEDSFMYTLTYTPDGDTDMATVYITVTDVPQAPVAMDATVNTSEDVPVTINLANYVSDVDGDLDLSSIVVNTDSTTDGTLVDNGDGTVTFTPDADYNGPAGSFTYDVSDSTPTTATGTITIVVDAVSDGVMAVDDDLFGADDDSDTVIASATLLANDYDIDSGDNTDLTIVSVDGSSSMGTVSFNSVSGEITYTPSSMMTGDMIDTFMYTITNSAGATDTATVSIEIIYDGPLAVDDTVVEIPALAIDEDTFVVIPVADILANDGHTDGVTPVTISDVDSYSANGGTVYLLGDNITYTPAPDFFGTDTFTYTITDGVDFATATVYVEVADVNDLPVVTIDNVIGDFNEGSVMTVTGTAYDPDGDMIYFDVFTASEDLLTIDGVTFYYDVLDLLNVTYDEMTGMFSIDFLILDDNLDSTGEVAVEALETAYIVVQVSDDPSFADFSEDSYIWTANNLAPSIDMATATVDGMTAMFDVDYSDPGFADVLTLTVSYGDGAIETFVVDDASVNSYSDMLSHVYAEAGTYTVTMVLSDDDDATVTQTLEVVIGVEEEPVIEEPVTGTLPETGIELSSLSLITTAILSFAFLGMGVLNKRNSLKK